LAALALVALISAGCGSNAPSETGTASNSGTGAAKKATDQNKAVKFAECIRAHGVPHFPDPDAKGDSNIGIDVTPEVWKRAVDACKDLEPPGALSARRTPKEQKASLRFAQCMRDHGMKDFPDPVDGEPLIDTTRIPSAAGRGAHSIPGFQAAVEKCVGVLGLAAGGQR
jgi:hypothetical protein